MGNFSCGNLDPPPSSGGQSAASSPSALHEDGLTKRFRRCRSPFREPPKSDRHPVGMVIAIARNTHTSEWVEYAFEKPATVSECRVYWFDDTGRGEVRVPAWWRLVYRYGNEWKPVRARESYGVEQDIYNRVAFVADSPGKLRCRRNGGQDRLRDSGQRHHAASSPRADGFPRHAEDHASGFILRNGSCAGRTHLEQDESTCVVFGM